MVSRDLKRREGKRTTVSKNSGNRQSPVIVWFREDLRLADNPALAAALETERPVIPLYILDEETQGLRRHGGASRWWLHHSLESLAKSLSDIGGTLVLRRGSTAPIMDNIVAETGAEYIVWNRRYGGGEIELDKALKSCLTGRGIRIDTFNGRLLNEPWTIKTSSGTPFQVFTPYWKAARASSVPVEPLAAPEKIAAWSGSIDSDDLKSWELLPTGPDWSKGIAACWTPGEAGAAERLSEFLEGRIDNYASRRDEPAVEATSRLSPHLAFGEISPLQIRCATEWPDTSGGEKNKRKFMSEIGWREFCYHLLFQYPDLAKVNIQSKFDEMDWADPGEAYKAWKKGQTGYPLVDAAMRQLWQTGWMHNRCRMVVGSFLVKHLQIDWRLGEQWFWDTLVDADPANNPAGWQWIAGSGADAAPYFRVFNPILQSRKFDPKGCYIRQFCPELADLSDDDIHAPWEADPETLKAAGVTLGETYPHPIVDHGKARKRALAAYEQVKNATG
jgi:deoxyribodipyrimidine photo-lyase